MGPALRTGAASLVPRCRLTPASPEDLAAALAFALRFAGHKRTHNADEIMAEIVVEHE